MYYLIFNNKKTIDLGMKVSKRPNIPIPERNIEFKSIKGRDGDLTRDYKTYKDIKISVSLNFISEENNFINKGAEISDWLYNIRDNRLIFSDNPNIYYKVKKIECNNIERSMKVIGRFIITFVCDPYKYYIDNRTITISKTNTVINSPDFTCSSLPKLTVYGDGDITIKINGKQFMLEKIEKNITVDSTLQECYRDMENTNYKMYGKFPKLECGKNIIIWEGNVTKIEIKTNWRCL
ncbi:phage tail family protein [Clostridium perfringens]|nr:phage tail family protein [Clostridium perfringens]